MAKKEDLITKAEVICGRTLDQLNEVSEGGGLELSALKELKVLSDVMKNLAVLRFYQAKAQPNSEGASQLSTQDLLAITKSELSE